MTLSEVQQSRPADSVFSAVRSHLRLLQLQRSHSHAYLADAVPGTRTANANADARSRRDGGLVREQERERRRWTRSRFADAQAALPGAFLVRELPRPTLQRLPPTHLLGDMHLRSWWRDRQWASQARHHIIGVRYSGVVRPRSPSPFRRRHRLHMCRFQWDS